MSGSAPGVPILSPHTLSPQGFLTQGNLLQTNTTLLQPLTGFYRLFDILWLLLMSQSSAAPAVTPLAGQQLHENALQTQVEGLQWQIEELQQKLDSAHARLDAAGL